MGLLTIFHIYKLLFLGSDGLADNYPHIHGAISLFRWAVLQLSIYTRCYFLVQRGCLTIILIYMVSFLYYNGCVTIIHLYRVLFLDLDGLADNYPHIHGAISWFRGVA